MWTPRDLSKNTIPVYSNVQSSQNHTILQVHWLLSFQENISESKIDPEHNAVKRQCGFAPNPQQGHAERFSFQPYSCKQPNSTPPTTGHRTRKKLPRQTDRQRERGGGEQCFDSSNYFLNDESPPTLGWYAVTFNTRQHLVESRLRLPVDCDSIQPAWQMAYGVWKVIEYESFDKPHPFPLSGGPV